MDAMDAIDQMLLDIGCADPKAPTAQQLEDVAATLIRQALATGITLDELKAELHAATVRH